MSLSRLQEFSNLQSLVNNIYDVELDDLDPEFVYDFIKTHSNAFATLTDVKRDRDKYLSGMCIGINYAEHLEKILNHISSVCAGWSEDEGFWADHITYKGSNEIDDPDEYTDLFQTIMDISDTYFEIADQFEEKKLKNIR